MPASPRIGTRWPINAETSRYTLRLDVSSSVAIASAVNGLPTAAKHLDDLEQAVGASHDGALTKSDC